MSEPLWTPDPRRRKQSELTRFTAFAEAATGLNLRDYEALHRWSIDSPESFWRLYWTFCELNGEPGEATLENGDQFPGATWFPNARLNFAENLLLERSEKIALISLLENGERREMSYARLANETAAVASALAEHGVTKGDRIAGWLPNVEEAVVAMLATSSIGSIWSSCSPDFGAAGALDRFGQIEPKVLFACDGYVYAGKKIRTIERVREVAAAIDSIEQVVWISVIGEKFDLEPREAFWDQWQNPGAELTFTRLPFDHPLYVLYSSGTTGAPKCIVHGQGGTLLQHRKEHQLHIDLKAEDTLFFFTTCGWMMWNWLVSALATRATIVLYDGSPLYPNADALFAVAEREGVTVLGVSAKFLSSAQKEGACPRETHDLADVRTLISTGSPLTQEGFEYVYRDIKTDVHLISMSGGTDIVSCFVIGNPNQPVYSGELQSPGLGMAVEIWNEAGQRVVDRKGELVCTRPFPSAPIGFWNDDADAKFRAAYFERFPGIWHQGDYAEETPNHGYIIHGRSDAVLNPGGVRIGTAEIYRQVEYFDEVLDAVCVGQRWNEDIRVILFVVLRSPPLDDDLIERIRTRIRHHASPRHVPARIIAVSDIPRTRSGKIAELAVRSAIHGEPVNNTGALANPEALDAFFGLSIQ